VSDQQIFFQTVANEAIMGIMAFDSVSKKCHYINRIARETIELSMDADESDLNPDIPLIISELFPEEGRAGTNRSFNEDMLRHEGLSQDVLMCKKNRFLFIANVGVKFIQLDDGTSRLLIMFQDTTIQKKLQREVQLKQEEIHKAYSELLEQNTQLKALDNAKDKFIALTTHELRTPLSAIVATADVLEMGLYESEEQKAEFIHTINEQAQQLMELVNDILDFAKIRAGKMEYYIEELPLLPLVQKLVTNFDQMARQAQVTLKIEATAGKPVIGYVDSLRLKEVVNNVVNNAIKYNRPDGSVTIKLEIHGENVARVSVRDTGQGMPADKLHHVFNEFETVGSVSQHHKGTGLGMPISKRLMQGMGGDLTLESEEGVGSVFFIDLPQTKVLSEEFYRSRPDAWGDFAA
jgi:signal transduction histidine kinase